MYSAKLVELMPVEETAFYFGALGFALEPREGLAQAQIGYSRHPDGSDLTGSAEGEWRREWRVFGRDTLLGDPFFADVSNERLPVYTAMHGMGQWKPDVVSESLAGFLAALDLLVKTSKQDADLAEPNEHTVSGEDELADIEAKLIELCGEESADFWENFMEMHTDWLVESEMIEADSSIAGSERVH